MTQHTLRVHTRNGIKTYTVDGDNTVDAIFLGERLATSGPGIMVVWYRDGVAYHRWIGQSVGVCWVEVNVGPQEPNRAESWTFSGEVRPSKLPSDPT